MRIRRSEEADLPQIFAIVNEAAQAYRSVIPADRWHEPYMPMDELEREIGQGVEFWVAEEDGHLLGVMGIQDRGDVALVRHAYVVSTTQRKGLGTTLLRHVEGLTDKPILIGTWAAASWAIEFYRRNGFTVVPHADKERLLRTYWSISDRQIEVSVVLADGRWMAAREPETFEEARVIPTLMVDLSPHTTTRLTLNDAPALQRLCERCGDYFAIEEGAPAGPGAAEHLLTALPSGRTLADKHVIGIHAPGGELVGVLDLVRDCPGEGEWWLGLLLLDPTTRTAGLGSRIVNEVKRVVAAEGRTAIYLGVLEHNASAERFWRRHHFTELRRQPYTSASGHPSRVIVMRHEC